MEAALADRIERQVKSAERGYYRLILVVGPAGAGKSQALQEIAARKGLSRRNVNLLLSELLVGLPPQQRALRAGASLSEAVGTVEGTALVLDNFEVLFDPALRVDPLRILQSLSRTRLVIASWAGVVEGADLIYAEPGHREYRRYSRPDAILISTKLAG